MPRLLLPALFWMSCACTAPAAELVSVLANGQSYAPGGGVLSVSDDGRYVLFPGAVANSGPLATQPLLVRDRAERTTALITNAQEANAEAVLSGDGSMIIATMNTYPYEGSTVSSLGWFRRDGSPLPHQNREQATAAAYGPVSLRTDVNGDTVIYSGVTGVQDCRSYVQTRSTVTTHGLDAFIMISPVNYDCAISSDGLWAVVPNGFAVVGSGGVSDNIMCVVDLVSGQATELSGSQGYWASSPTEAAVSRHGDVVAYLGNAPDGSFGVLAYDRDTDATTRVDVSARGAQGNGNVAYPSISLDGEVIGFISNATNLVAGVTDGRWHAYAVNRTTHAVHMVSVGAAGAVVQGNGILSGNGLYMVGYSGDHHVDPSFPHLAGGAYLFVVANGKQ